MIADTTTRWPQPLGQINLSPQWRVQAKRRANPDLRASEGLILAVLIGANAWIWGYVFVRWLIG